MNFPGEEHLKNLKTKFKSLEDINAPKYLISTVLEVNK